jgi:molecular chaperone DnaK (HSP70)
MPTRSSVARSSVTLPLRDSAERVSYGFGPSSSHAENNWKGKGRSSKPRLIVGIDYGTTYTSVAYRYISEGQESSSGSLGAQLRDVQDVQEWPAATETPFVPTVSMYDSAEERPLIPKWWGYKVARALKREEVPNTAYAVHLAKLILHEARETQRETIRLKELSRNLGKEQIDLIEDFLRQIHNYLLGDAGYFQEHHASYLNDVDIEFVFGVPAAWSEPEQQAMIEAATEVGFTNPSRGSEPEAMATVFFAQHETSLEVSYC